MKEIIIQENDDSQRLDKFLKKLLVNSSLSLIYKLNRKNQIKINWKRQDNDYRLLKGDIIKLFINDREYEDLTKKQEVEKLPQSNKLDKKDIVYEEKWLLIVNKNPSLNVHPGDHKTKEISLIAQVHDYLWDSLNSLTFKPSLVHRIDRDTSWMVMIAKTKQFLDFLLKELQSHRIDKYYLAICKWSLPKTEWTIKARIEKIENAKKEDKVQISDKWQEAITRYKVVKEFSDSEWVYSLVECKLETWRMHQIRVHLAHLWCPIIGDDKYWDKKFNSYLKRNYQVERQFLHAYKLSFMHPVKKIKVTYKARLKDDMNGFLEKMGVNLDYKNI